MENCDKKKFRILLYAVNLYANIACVHQNTQLMRQSPRKAHHMTFGLASVDIAEPRREASEEPCSSPLLPLSSSCRQPERKRNARASLPPLVQHPKRCPVIRAASESNQRIAKHLYVTYCIRKGKEVLSCGYCQKEAATLITKRLLEQLKTNAKP